jgi:hypothetical protein
VLRVRTIKRIVNCAEDTVRSGTQLRSNDYAVRTRQILLQALNTLYICSSGVGTDARECAHRYPFKTSSGHLCAPTVEAMSSCDIVTYGPSESESLAYRVCRRTTSDTNAVIAAVGLDRWINWDCPNKRSSEVLRDNHFRPCPLMEHTYTYISGQLSFVRMQFCEWLQHQDLEVHELFLHTQNSVDRRSAFYVLGCFQCSGKSRNGTGYSSCCLLMWA